MTDIKVALLETNSDRKSLANRYSRPLDPGVLRDMLKVTTFVKDVSAGRSGDNPAKESRKGGKPLEMHVV